MSVVAKLACWTLLAVVALWSLGSAAAPAAPTLAEIVGRWRAHDTATLRRWATVDKPSVAATLSAYFLHDLGEADATRLFVRDFPRDGTSLYWFAASEPEWRAACAGAGEGPCAAAGPSDFLLALAVGGDVAAIDAFLDGWLIHTDASVHEFVCEQQVPKLLSVQPRLVIEETVKRPKKTRQELLSCLQFSMAGSDAGKRLADRIASMPMGGPKLQLRDRVVERLRKADADWP
jgi:hypothetical protein